MRSITHTAGRVINREVRAEAQDAQGMYALIAPAGSKAAGAELAAAPRAAAVKPAASTAMDAATRGVAMIMNLPDARLVMALTATS